MADLILANGEKITKFAKINSLQNYPLYGIYNNVYTATIRGGKVNSCTAHDNHRNARGHHYHNKD